MLLFYVTISEAKRKVSKRNIEYVIYQKRYQLLENSFTAAFAPLTSILNNRKILSRAISLRTVNFPYLIRKVGSVLECKESPIFSFSKVKSVGEVDKFKKE